MKAPLSHEEFQALDRQVSHLAGQLTEVAGLIESRLGASSELARIASVVQQDLAAFARRIHRQHSILNSVPLEERTTQTA